ncbi:site-specific integrase [Paenibacillus sp. LK1]|uniref:phage lytic cycle repressor MrpR family protein n=1 Tax=Paenibacillus sp. LK1 TaxID=2053014 RepID=UPI000C185F66|nr:site-specific integrase [Paenibacillus sp. LK1]PIH59112.1 hypothetical protein CS562_14325 [Paenibacillus sp. LK1]
MNKIYYEEFYNPNQKSRYLKDQIESTKKAYSRVLLRAAKIENKLGKDLYDFNLDEIKQLLFILKATKLSTVMHSGNIIQNYIRWAIEQDLRTDNINPLDAVASGEFYKQFLDTSEQTLFSYTEIKKDVVDECINYQDKAVILGLYEGIYGRQYSELLTLKMKFFEEINDDPDHYNVRLINETVDGNKERTLKVTSDLYNIMRIANDEDIYFKNNGLDFEGMRNNKNYLVKTDYIIRAAENARTKSSGNTPSAPALINRRIARIAEMYQLPMLTATNIRNSGMLKLASELYYENDKKLGKEDYEQVLRQYNVGIGKNGEISYGRLKADFLNIENIEKFYGEE